MQFNISKWINSLIQDIEKKKKNTKNHTSLQKRTFGFDRGDEITLKIYESVHKMKIFVYNFAAKAMLHDLQ